MTLDTAELKPLVEALIFVSDSPVRLERLAEVLECDKEVVGRAVELLKMDYASGRGVILQEVAEGYQFRTSAESAEWIRRLSKTRPFRFSRAALETLAIIAYRQPITRAEIEYLRGVDSGGVVKTLLEKHLVRMLGKKDVPGRPIMYGTSKEFLEFFGLRELGQLPALREFSELLPEHQLQELEPAQEGSP
jgi:segregation and condensation protein B